VPIPRRNGRSSIMAPASMASSMWALVAVALLLGQAASKDAEAQPAIVPNGPSSADSTGDGADALPSAQVTEQLYSLSRAIADTGRIMDLCAAGDALRAAGISLEPSLGGLVADNGGDDGGATAAAAASAAASASSVSTSEGDELVESQSFNLSSTPPPAVCKSTRHRASLLFKRLVLLSSRFGIVPESVRAEASRVERELKTRGGRTKLARVFRHSFLQALLRHVRIRNDNTTFVSSVPGASGEMELRQSALLLYPYMALAKNDLLLQLVIEGAIRSHLSFIERAPYATAFRSAPKNHSELTPDDVRLGRTRYVASYRYSLDAHCYTLWMVHSYWKATNRTDVFTVELRRVVELILRLWRREQHHEELSVYRHAELERDGRGAPVGWTGMVWSGYRPSSQPCELHFNVPANMFAAQVLEFVQEWARIVWEEKELELRAAKLQNEILRGIDTFAIQHHPARGTLYAYEVDGMGKALLMDEALPPSLVSVPWFGFRDEQDPDGEILRATRALALSPANPLFAEGPLRRGIVHLRGSGRVSSVALAVQALTATDAAERTAAVKALVDGAGDDGALRAELPVVEVAEAGGSKSTNGDNAPPPDPKHVAMAQALLAAAVVAKLDEL
jgi:meiotically up-regulated gene 157 (Mug157) protein